QQGGKCSPESPAQSRPTRRGGPPRPPLLSLGPTPRIPSRRATPARRRMPLVSRASVPLARPAAYVLKVAALAVVYYAAARLGLRYASIGQSISLVWPPTGIALAGLIILGRSYWPGVA